MRLVRAIAAWLLYVHLTQESQGQHRHTLSSVSPMVDMQPGSLKQDIFTLCPAGYPWRSNQLAVSETVSYLLTLHFSCCCAWLCSSRPTLSAMMHSFAEATLDCASQTVLAKTVLSRLYWPKLY